MSGAIPDPAGCGVDTAVVPAGLAHAALLAALHEAAFPPAEAWSEAALATLLASPGSLGFLALRPGAQAGAPDPAGFVLARVAADEAEILTIAVLPGARRQGHGRALLAAAAQGARVAGARRLFLEVATDNPAAAALYRQAGLVEVGRRRGYYDRPGAAPVDALILAGDLSRLG